eukprot:UC1_evm6s1056
MQIFVKVKEGGAEEWMILELQGTVQARGERPLDRLPLGHLKMKGTTPELLIGHHQLKGKIVKLEKPYGVLQKNTAPRGEDGSPGEVSYEVLAYIKRKLIFSARPKPLVR